MREGQRVRKGGEGEEVREDGGRGGRRPECGAKGEDMAT